MPREFAIPAVSEGVTSVDIAALHVKEGDSVAAGTVVAEVETDKAAAEIEIDFGGKILKVHAKPGDSLPVGSVLLSVEEGAGAVAASKEPSPPPKKEAATAPAPKPAEHKPGAVAAPSTPKPATVQPAATTSTPAKSETHFPAPAGPATRRLARELGVDLHQIRGTAAGGRITQEDIKAFVKQTLGSGPALPSGGGGGSSPPPLPDFSKWGPTDREPLNKIARAAAANLSMCWHVIPHVTQQDLVDVTELEAARKRHSEAAQKTGEPKITMTAIAMKAVAVCLQEFPKFNSSLDPQTNELVYKRYYHIGCAVDTPNGLLVPVLRDVNQKTISQIAGELTDLAVRARERKLSLDDMQGATFTITNLGGIGGTAFSPIVNYPEVAILGMSRSRVELRLRSGQIEERLMLPLSLSYDHRVINGADAARFVVRLGQLLSDHFSLAAHA